MKKIFKGIFLLSFLVLVLNSCEKENGLLENNLKMNEKNYQISKNVNAENGSIDINYSNFGILDKKKSKTPDFDECIWYDADNTLASAVNDLIDDIYADSGFIPIDTVSCCLAGCDGIGVVISGSLNQWGFDDLRLFSTAIPTPEINTFTIPSDAMQYYYIKLIDLVKLNKPENLSPGNIIGHDSNIPMPMDFVHINHAFDIIYGVYISADIKP